MSDSYSDIIEECELVDDYGGKTRPRRCMKKCDSWADASIDSIAGEGEVEGKESKSNNNNNNENKANNVVDTTYSNQNPFKGLHQRRTSWDDIDILELIKKEEEEEEEEEEIERNQMSFDGKAISLFVSRDVYYNDNDNNNNSDDDDDDEQQQDGIDNSTDNPNIFLVANFDEAFVAKNFGNNNLLKATNQEEEEEEKTEEIEPTTSTKKPSSLKRILLNNKSGTSTNPATTNATTTTTNRNSSKKHNAAALKGLSNRLGLMSPFKSKKKPVDIVGTAELIASA